MAKHMTLRLPDDLAEQIDQRREQVGLSRNEWIVRAAQWALEQPVTKRTVEQEV